MGKQSCLVRGCGRFRTASVRCGVFKFPKDEDLAKKWLDFAGWKPEDIAYRKSSYGICERHFPEDWLLRRQSVCLIPVDAVPFMNGPPDKSEVELSLSTETNPPPPPMAHSSSPNTKPFEAKPLSSEIKPLLTHSLPLNATPLDIKPPLLQTSPLNAMPLKIDPLLTPSSPSNVNPLKIEPPLVHSSPHKPWPLSNIQPNLRPWTSPLKFKPRTNPYSRGNTGPSMMAMVNIAVLTTAVVLNAYVPLYLPGATMHKNMDFAPPPKYYITDEDDDDEYPTPWVLVKKYGFASLFDNSKRIPVYSKEELTPESFIKGQGVVRKNKFHRELDLGVLFQADSESYKLSGLHKGHLAPAADFVWGQFAMDESFSFVNIFPQNPKLNQIAWKKIEDRVRGFVKCGVNATVFTGTAFIATDGEVRYKVLGKKMVAVPTHVWKAVRVKQRDGQEFVWCWLMPNKETPPKQNINDYFCSVEDIAHATGVRVFKKTKISRLNPF